MMSSREAAELLLLLAWMGVSWRLWWLWQTADQHARGNWEAWYRTLDRRRLTEAYNTGYNKGFAAGRAAMGSAAAGLPLAQSLEDFADFYREIGLIPKKEPEDE